MSAVVEQTKTVEAPYCSTKYSTKDYIINHHLIISGGLLVEAAAAFLLAQTSALPVPSDEAHLFDDTRLIGLCVMGAMLGAFLSIALFPPKDDASDKIKLQGLALKFGASLATGIGLTPLVIKYFQLPLGSDWVVGMSTAVAAFGVLTIHIGLPFIQKAIEKFFGTWSKP